MCDGIEGGLMIAISVIAATFPQTMKISGDCSLERSVEKHMSADQRTSKRAPLHTCTLNAECAISDGRDRNGSDMGRNSETNS